LPILLLLPVVGLVISLCSLAIRGIDFTDEGQYLNSIATPQAYLIDLPASLFGYIYHPLYLLLGDNVAALRLANLGITYLLAFAFAAIVFRAYYCRAAGDQIVLVALSATLATFAFAPCYWLPFTPSYNWLSLQGLIITCIGLAVANRRPTLASVAGWLTIGLGGWLTFMAKPSSGAALSFAAVAYLVLSGRGLTRLLSLPVVLAGLLLVVSSLIVSSGPIGFIHRLAFDTAVQYLLGAGQEFGKILRFDSVDLTRLDWLVAVALPADAALIMLCLARGPQFLRWTCVLSGMLLALMTALLQILLPNLPPYTGQGLIVCLVPILVLALGLGTRKTRWEGRDGLYFSVFLFVLPYVYAFGTNGNYWHAGANASLFWVLSGVIGVALWGGGRLPLGTLVVPACLLPLLTTLIALNINSRPYRQPPDMRSYSTRYEIPGGGSLILSAGYAQYLAEIRDMAKTAGASVGTDVIDLTGQSPGALFAAGLRSVGLPWLVGGYPGSQPTAEAALATQKCEVLVDAWLFEEPGGPRSLPSTVLASFGAHESDYVEVGSVPVPPYAGGYESRPDQILLKPTRPRSEAVSACRAARAAGQTPAPSGAVEV
jgi:hypothetical protein